MVQRDRCFGGFKPRTRIQHMQATGGKQQEMWQELREGKKCTYVRSLESLRSTKIGIFKSYSRKDNRKTVVYSSGCGLGAFCGRRSCERWAAARLSVGLCEGLPPLLRRHTDTLLNTCGWSNTTTVGSQALPSQHWNQGRRET